MHRARCSEIWQHFFLFFKRMNTVFICILPAYLLRGQLFSRLFLPASLYLYTPCVTLIFFFLCQFYALPIVRKIAEPTYISFPNENQWVGLLYIDTAATQLVAVDSEEKQWGAINNLVIRAQSRMVIWGKGTCSKQKGRCEQEKWERNGCDTRSCMIYGG